MSDAFCKRCGEFSLFGNHTCPPQWYCISGDDRDDLPPTADEMADGRAIYASDAKAAAIKFAEWYQGFHSEFRETMTVWVMDLDETQLSKYMVDGEMVPSYSVAYSYKPEITIPKYEEGE
jgi:hypothetical protein